MSVTVNYKGRSGNKLFQYAAARMFAEMAEYAIPMDQRGPSDLIPCTDYNNREFKSIGYSGPVITITDKLTQTLGRIFIGNGHPCYGKYHFDGWFQVAAWYEYNRARVESYFELPPVIITSDIDPYNDIVMHVRLGDYQALKWVIDPAWYREVLKREKWRHLHIVTDDWGCSEYLKACGVEPDRIKISVRSYSDPRADFHFIRAFDRIICSNSTFAWWAQYFSKASRVYLFKPWLPPPHCQNNGIDLVTGVRNGVAVDGGFWR